MAAIFEFARNIAVYLVFMGLSSAFAPEGKFKGYVDLLLSVILVIMLITPAAALLNSGFDDILADLGLNFERRTMAGDFSFNNAEENELILSIYQNNLREQLRRLVSANSGFYLVRSTFIIGDGPDNFGEIKEIWLTVSREETAARNWLIRIEPITINPGTGIGITPGQQMAETADDMLLLKNLLSDFYNVPKDNIHITY